MSTGGCSRNPYIAGQQNHHRLLEDSWNEERKGQRVILSIPQEETERVHRQTFGLGFVVNAGMPPEQALVAEAHSFSVSAHGRIQHIRNIRDFPFSPVRVTRPKEKPNPNSLFAVERRYRPTSEPRLPFPVNSVRRA
jgi:hypothetical protein